MTLSDTHRPPQHAEAFFYGLGAAVLTVAVWSGLGVLAEWLAIPAAYGMGWLVGWACGYGARTVDDRVRIMAVTLATYATLVGTFLIGAFNVTQTSPDAGFSLHAVWPGWVKLCNEPPWLTPAAALLAIAGAWRPVRTRRVLAAVSPLGAPARAESAEKSSAA